MLQVIDNFLIDRVLQPATNFAALVPHLSRYNLSRLATWIGFALTFLQIRNGWTIGDDSLSGMDVVNFFFLGVLLYSARRFERIDGQASVLVFPAARLQMRYWRYLMIALTPIALMPTPFPWTVYNVVSNFIVSVSQLAAVFVLACRAGEPPRLRFRLPSLSKTPSFIPLPSPS
jgi:hypothetical protein